MTPITDLQLLATKLRRLEEDFQICSVASAFLEEVAKETERELRVRSSVDI